MIFTSLSFSFVKNSIQTSLVRRMPSAMCMILCFKSCLFILWCIMFPKTESWNLDLKKTVGRAPWTFIPNVSTFFPQPWMLRLSLEWGWAVSWSKNKRHNDQPLFSLVIKEWAGPNNQWERSGINNYCQQGTFSILISALPSFLFLLFRATPMAYRSSQARGQIGAVAADLPHSHSNGRSEPHLRPAPQLVATPDP